MAVESRRPVLSRPAVSSVAVSIPPRILAQLQREDALLPAVPALVGELRELVQRTGTRLDTIVAIVERDPALVARVLQLGRSAQFGRPSGPGIADLHYIINRVGFRQLGSVLDTVWENSCFAIGDERYQPCVARLTRFAVARALAMRALAERLRLEPFPAYLAGLFADVGATFLLWALVDKTQGHVPELSEALAFMREHHEAVSASVLERWRHPELVVALGRRHHNPVLTGSGAVHAALVVLGSDLAAKVTGEHDLTSEEPFPPQPLLERCILLAGLGQGAHDDVLPRVRDEFARAAVALAAG